MIKFSGLRRVTKITGIYWDNVSGIWYDTFMNTIDELIETIYKSNYSHIDFMENMNGGDCDCLIHISLNTIAKFAGIKGDIEC